MRILISRFATQKTLGGAEGSACLHCMTLNKLNHPTQLLSNFSCSKCNVKTIGLTYNPHFQLFLSWLLLLRLPFIKRNFDMINPHSRVDQIIFTLTKSLHQKPVIWKDPGDIRFFIKENRSSMLAKLLQNIYLQALQKADAVYMLNENEKSILLDKLGALSKPVDADKLHVIPSDISFSDYSLDAKPPKKAGMVIGTVIRLDEHKGVQYLMSAFQQLKLRDAEMWIVGDGPYREELEKLASNTSNVKFWGYQKDVSSYLNSLDIFVQPAKSEGWGRNVKEAMYFGKPVIGSNTGGIAVQIEDGKTGLLFEPGNVKELTEKLELLINDKALREKLGKAARKKAIKDGDYVQLIKTKVLPLFEEVIKQRK